MPYPQTSRSLLVTGLTFIILLLIGILSFWITSDNRISPFIKRSHNNRHHQLTQKEPLQIHVTGKKFKWYFRYPGADGEHGTSDDFESGQNLYVPVNHEVKLSLTSSDYIYIFVLEKFNRREIAIPDLTFDLTFRAEQTDRFDIRVDPMCGYKPFHDEVMGRLHILEQDQFWKWYQSQ